MMIFGMQPKNKTLTNPMKRMYEMARIDLFNAIQKDVLRDVEAILMRYMWADGIVDGINDRIINYPVWKFPIFYARSVPMLKLLISYGADVFSIPGGGVTLVRHFCDLCQLDILAYLINEGWFDNFENIHEQYVNYHTKTFAWSIRCNNLDMCKILYGDGAKIFTSPASHLYLLHDAVAQETLWNNTQIIDWLLRLKYKTVSIHDLNYEGRTVLEMAELLDTKKLILKRMFVDTFLVMRSTLSCPRLSRSRKLAKLPREMYELVAAMFLPTNSNWENDGDE